MSSTVFLYNHIPISPNSPHVIVYLRHIFILKKKFQMPKIHLEQITKQITLLTFPFDIFTVENTLKIDGKKSLKIEVFYENKIITFNYFLRNQCRTSR